MDRTKFRTGSKHTWAFCPPPSCPPLRPPFEFCPPALPALLPSGGSLPSCPPCPPALLWNSALLPSLPSCPPVDLCPPALLALLPSIRSFPSCPPCPPAPLFNSALLPSLPSCPPQDFCPPIEASKNYVIQGRPNITRSNPFYSKTVMQASKNYGIKPKLP